MTKLCSTVLMSFFLVAACTCNNNKPQVNETGSATGTSITVASDNNPTGGRTLAETDSMAAANNVANNTANGQTGMYKNKGYTRSRYTGHTPGEFPEGSDKILTDTDVKYLSQWGLKVMLNEIYARHGQTFPKDPELEEHFRRVGWYRGANPNVSKQLTRIERQNVAFLNSYQYKPGIE